MGLHPTLCVLALLGWVALNESEAIASCLLQLKT
jgi:hypothetical protein